MRKTSLRPVRSESNAITEPSGAQAALSSVWPGSSVRFSGAPDPLASRAKISRSPVRSDVHRMVEPSGDHAGWTLFDGPNVNWDRFDPAASMIQISKLPVRFEAKAMREPSGDHAGLSSTPWAFERS